MVSETIMIALQFAVVFATTIVFSIIALERKSVVSNGLAMLLWVAFAFMNFMIGYTLIGSAISFILGLIGFIFAGNFVIALYNNYTDSKQSRFEF